MTVLRATNVFMNTSWKSLAQVGLGLMSVCILAGCGPDPEITDLKRRVAELEKKFSLVDTSSIQTKKNEQQERQSSGRLKFEERLAQDRQKYSRDELSEAEALYQVANKHWNTPEAYASLKQMVEKYPKLNRTGCALLYMAQQSQGSEREKYLKQCIENYNDCFYGDGVQVGAYARFYLANYYKQGNQTEKAKALCDEIKVKFPESIDHQGKLLVTMVD